MTGKEKLNPCFRRFQCTLAVAGILWMLAGQAMAAAPKFTTLFPAGGQQGTQVTTTVSGTLDPWPLKIHSSSPGLEITAEKDKGKLAIRIAPDAAPTIHWFRLYNDEGATPPIPFVVGLIPEMQETEPNNEVSGANPVESLPVTVNGVLSKSEEVDSFRVTLKKGQTLVASLRGNTTLGSPMDAVLQVVSADGFVLEQNDDFHGLDPQLTYSAPKDGEYVVRTFAFPSTPNSSIRFSGGSQYVYRLTLTAGGFADFAVPLAVTRQAPGQVQVSGWNFDGPVVPADGPQIGDRMLLTAPGAANAVAAKLVDHPSLVETEGESPQELTPPVSVTGRIASPGEVDEYRMQAKKGQRLTFSLEARSLQLPIDPVLTIVNDKGSVLREIDDASRNDRDVELAFSVPADGPLLLKIKDLHGRGGNRYAYRFTVVETTTDYTLTVDSEQFNVKADKPTEITVKIDRKNGFDEDIEISAEGLPEGVTAEPVVSNAKGKEAKEIKLKLTTTLEAPTAGAFQIVGLSKGKAAYKRAATAAIPNHTQTTSDVWLTVLKK